MKSKLEETFDNYLKHFDMNDKQINFKYRHSYRVKDLMKELAIKLGLSSKKVELAEVIGLLHDIGRFEQIKKYGISSDIESGIDHADESCVYLFDQGHIKDFYDDENYYDLIKDAIKYHNKYKINDDVKNDSLLFSKMIRDMDKVDIYRVIGEEFTGSYNKNDISKEVWDSYMHKTLADNRYIKTKTDSVYGYLTFLYDIYFTESFQILKNSKNMEKYFSIVIPNEDSIDRLNKLKEDTLLYIDKKSETNK